MNNRKHELEHVHEKRLFDEITFCEYSAKLRTLLGHFFKIQGTGSDKWCKSGGRSKWQVRIDGIKMAKVTPVAMARFMVDYVANRTNEGRSTHKRPKRATSAGTCIEGSDSTAQLRAKHTIDCLVRNARALFSRRKIIPHLTISLPKELPFDGVKLLHEDDAEFRFVKEVDPIDLLGRAVNELARRSRAQFVIFLLCLGTGLRRNEVDKLCWRDVNCRLGTVEISRSEFQKGKSQSSLRKVRIPLPFIEALTAFRGNAADDQFVIPSSALPKVNETYRHYRCSEDFGALCQWLRENGIKREGKPMHSLRKYFGDVICSNQGIYAATAALGHQKVSTTERHYAAPPDVSAAPFVFADGRNPLIVAAR